MDSRCGVMKGFPLHPPSSIETPVPEGVREAYAFELQDYRLSRRKALVGRSDSRTQGDRRLHGPRLREKYSGSVQHS